MSSIATPEASGSGAIGPRSSESSPEWWALFWAADKAGDALPCRQQDQSWWFPSNRVTPDELDHARALCARCPILDPCRAYGIVAGRAEDGIWGGLTKAERVSAGARGHDDPGKAVTSSWEPAT